MRFRKYIAGIIIFTLFYGCAGTAVVKKEVSNDIKKAEVTAVAVTSTAVEKQDVASVLKKDGEKSKFKVKELVINSDSMTYNKDTTEALFRGNVEAQASNILIKSDMLKSKNYKDNAEAYGNVTAFYKEQGVVINCAKMIYKNRLSVINAYEDVVVKKTLANGEIVTMKGEEIAFNAEDNSITAKKIKKRIRVTLKDIIAFCDELSYNDKTKELLMTGSPMVKKDKSTLLAESIMLNVEKKTMKMKQNIWTKIFYGDFEQPVRRP